MVIMLLALVVLGPDKLPDAARTVGRWSSEIRRMSNGFRSEMKAAFDEETARSDARSAQAAMVSGPDDDTIEAEARARGAALTGTTTDTGTEPDTGAEPDAEPASSDEP